MAFGIGKKIKKTVKKVTRSVKKAWDEIDDYAVPLVAGAGIGIATGGLGVLAAGGLSAGAGVAAGAASAAGISGTTIATSLVGGGALGAMSGLQVAQANRMAEKQELAAKEAEREEHRQRVAINSMATGGATPTQMTTAASSGADGAASARRKRYSTDKTTRASSTLGLSRYAASTSTRVTLG